MELYQATATASSSYDAASYSASLTSDYDTFIQLLAVQLENQDPTDPMDTNELTSQLTSYASVEQQVLTNDMLSSLLTASEVSQNGNPTDYLGQEVTFTSDTAALQNGEAAWQFDLPSDTQNAVVTITDSNGESVYEETLSSEIGTVGYSWDGLDKDGNQLEDGLYSLSVKVNTGNDSAVLTDIRATGTVNKVDWSSGNYLLDVDGQTVNSTSVMAVASR